MPLTQDAIEQQKAEFARRTEDFAAHGFDRFGAPEFILDQADRLEGPALDVGSGKGITARALAARGLDVVSIDLCADDQQMAAVLTPDPAQAERIRYVLTDAACTPFPDGHFGCAVAIDVLHHLENGAAVLIEIVRVVRPGGTIVLADFSPDGFAMVSRVFAADGLDHPEGPITIDWARGCLSALGAEEVRVSSGHAHRVAVFRAPARASAGATGVFASLDREGLVTALDVFAKNWLAHDGCWFLAAEERYGMQVAVELDTASWRRFAAAEARRIMAAFGVPKDGGLDALERALAFRMYSFINPYRFERSADGLSLRFAMESCRVQETRHRKGLPDFACKPVGIVEFETFARTVDPRIVTTCVHCPPDADAQGHCQWEFRLRQG